MLVLLRLDGGDVKHLSRVPALQLGQQPITTTEA